ncbi:hypothetical protein V3C99_004782, partial [Haemonchus contortus]
DATAHTTIRVSTHFIHTWLTSSRMQQGFLCDNQQGQEGNCHTHRKKWNKWNQKRQRNRGKTSVRSNHLEWANSVAQR